MTNKENNLNKLKEIENLKDNWNGNGAKPFNDYYINYIKLIIENIDEDLQPEIFPIADGNIQFEWEFSNLYLEMIIINDRKFKLFYADGNTEKDPDFENGTEFIFYRVKDINYLLRLILKDRV